MSNTSKAQFYSKIGTIDRITKYFDGNYASWGSSVYESHPDRWHEYNISMFRENYALEMLDREPKGTAVDLGCGIGHMLVSMNQVGYKRVIGIDISQNMLTEAGRLLTANKLLSKVELHRSDVQDLTMIDSGSVDVCTALGVIEYQDEDGPLLREVNRILKPGGAAVIQMRNYDCIYIRTLKQYQAALHKMPAKIAYREHRPREVRTALPKYGFSVEKEYFSHFYALYPLNIVPKLNRLIRPFDNYLSKHCESLSRHSFSKLLASMYIILIRKRSDQ